MSIIVSLVPSRTGPGRELARNTNMLNKGLGTLLGYSKGLCHISTLVYKRKKMVVRAQACNPNQQEYGGRIPGQVSQLDQPNRHTLSLHDMFVLTYNVENNQGMHMTLTLASTCMCLYVHVHWHTHTKPHTHVQTNHTQTDRPSTYISHTYPYTQAHTHIDTQTSHTCTIRIHHRYTAHIHPHIHEQGISSSLNKS